MEHLQRNFTFNLNWNAWSWHILNIVNIRGYRQLKRFSFVMKMLNVHNMNSANWLILFVIVVCCLVDSTTQQQGNKHILKYWIHFLKIFSVSIWFIWIWSAKIWMRSSSKILFENCYSWIWYISRWISVDGSHRHPKSRQSICLWWDTHQRSSRPNGRPLSLQW